MSIEYHGNNYGGFMIHEIKEPGIVYSFGIGEDISFEESIKKKYKAVEIWGFDPTPRAIEFIKEKNNSWYYFLPIGLSDKNGMAKFYLPNKAEYVSASMYEHNYTIRGGYIDVEMKTLSSIMNELKHKKILVLKMDIEGAEFNAISDILNGNLEIQQICLEFHHRFFDNKGNKMLLSCAKKLNSKGYDIKYISDNMTEFSFYKANR